MTKYKYHVEQYLTETRKFIVQSNKKLDLQNIDNLTDWVSLEENAIYKDKDCKVMFKGTERGYFDKTKITKTERAIR
jgi:hypothetical protein